MAEAPLVAEAAPEAAPVAEAAAPAEAEVAAAEPAPGRVCVAFLHGEVILASLRQKDGCWWLAPAKRAPVQVDDSVEVWAIIKALVRMRV